MRRVLSGSRGAVGVVAAIASLGVAASADAASKVPGEIIVGFQDGASPMERGGAISSVPAESSEALEVPDTRLVRLESAQDTAGALAELRADPAVRYAEPNFLVRATDLVDEPRFKEQWGLRNEGQSAFGPRGVAGADVSIDEAWTRTTGNPFIYVAVLDTGVAREHPDLAGAMLPGWDFVDDDEIPEDRNGHGTHVAGIIAARQNGLGIAGVAPKVRIVPVRVLDEYGVGTTADVAEGILFARRRGARVINLSLSGPGPLVLQDAIARVSQSSLVVAAAGNGGFDHDRPWRRYPCDFTFDHVVCVAATNAKDELASFSDRGRWSVDLAAPGENILSLQPRVETLMRENFEAADVDAHWLREGPDNDWRRIPERAFSYTHTMGSTAPWVPGQANEEKKLISARSFEFGGARRPCRFSASVHADLGGAGDHLGAGVFGSSQGSRSIYWYSDTGRVRESTAFDHFEPFNGRVFLSLQRTQGSGHVNVDDVWLRCVRWRDKPNGYDFLSGTSMAAPMVAGVAALRYSLYPREAPQQVRAALLSGVDRLPTLDGVTVSGGRLNAARTLAVPATPPAPKPSGTITTLAGAEDGLVRPTDVDLAPDGSLLITDRAQRRVFKRYSDGRMQVVAGNGQRGISGDGGPATQASFESVGDVEALPDGGFLLPDVAARKVRRVFADGTIDTVAGTGEWGDLVDGAPAKQTPIPEPVSVAAMADGSFFIGFYSEDRLARVTPDGVIHYAEGRCGIEVFLGCVGILPQITVRDEHSLLVSTEYEHVLSMQLTGELERLAGSPGISAFGGDGGPALDAVFEYTGDLTALPDGGFAVIDGTTRIRRVLPDGRIITVAGSGIPGDRGDGGPAIEARLDTPLAIAAVPGGVVITELYSSRVRFIEFNE